MKADDIARIFRHVLELDEIDESSDLFALGGDSLLATRVLTAIAKECGIHLSLADVMRSPTPAGLSETLCKAGT